MAASTCNLWPSDRSKIVDILSALFGLGAWVGIVGIYTQLPLLVVTAPEGWQLPSLMVIVVQISNIGVVAVWLIKMVTGDPSSVSIYIYCLMTIGCAAMLICSFFYEYTVYIGDHLQSVPFIVLVFLISMGSCVSSVLYFPYMARFHEKYLVPYMVGEGLGGFLPGIISFGQGIGGNPQCVDGQPVYSPAHFGVATFMRILFGLMVTSFVAFALLDNLGALLKGKRADSGTNFPGSLRNTLDSRRLSPVDTNARGERKRTSSQPMEVRETSLYDRNWTASVEDDDSVSEASTTIDVQCSVAKTQPSDLDCSQVPSRQKVVSFLLLQGVLCLLSHAVLPAIQSYSCLPYGNTIYHLSINLGAMANPLVCYLAFFLPHSSTRLITSLSTICVFSAMYILVAAIMSPVPPLLAHSAGGVLMVLSWVVNSASVSYAKLAIATVFRSRGGRGLFLYGVATQIGSAIGSLMIFFIVNFADVFHNYDPCSTA